MGDAGEVQTRAGAGGAHGSGAHCEWVCGSTFFKRFVDCGINRVPFSVDGGGVRANDGQADNGHEVHSVQHLLQEDPRHMDRHRIYYSPLSPLLRLPGSFNSSSNVEFHERVSWSLAFATRKWRLWQVLSCLCYSNL